jgi:hypothetical protein
MREIRETMFHKDSSTGSGDDHHKLHPQWGRKAGGVPKESNFVSVKCGKVGMKPTIVAEVRAEN